MSRHTSRERRERRGAQDALAELGEGWLRVRDNGTFTDFGFDTWQEYLDGRAARLVARDLGLTRDQGEQLVGEGVRLAIARRRSAAARRRRGR